MPPSRTRALEVVRAVDVEEVDLAGNLHERTSRGEVHVPDALPHTRALEVLLEAHEIRGSCLVLLVGIDRYELRLGRGAREHDRRAAVVASDLDDSRPRLERGGALVEQASLVLRQPAVDVPDGGEDPVEARHAA